MRPLVALMSAQAIRMRSSILTVACFGDSMVAAAGGALGFLAFRFWAPSTTSSSRLGLAVVLASSVVACGLEACLGCELCFASSAFATSRRSPNAPSLLGLEFGPCCSLSIVLNLHH